VDQAFIDIACNLGVALLVGSLIGLERTFAGRPAGFRTHALVCVASAVLMHISTYQGLWLDWMPMETIRTDPTRMAQGIMTGIGFLGAGVIFKEGLTVRGLTTAASIWMTAAIGTLLGVGFYFPGLLAAAITFGILSVFRLLESWFPSRHFALHVLRCLRKDMLREDEIQEILKRHNLSIVKINRRLCANGQIFEYRMVVKTLDPRNFDRLSDHLLEVPAVREFQVSTLTD